MGRAERRRAERQARIEERKGKILITPSDLAAIKREIMEDVKVAKTDVMFTCFALALNRVHNFGYKRIARVIGEVDEMMGEILEGTKTVDDFYKELEEKTGVDFGYERED